MEVTLKLRGVVNIPVVEDILAIRASVYRHDTSGFVKNIAGTQLATGGESRPGALAQSDAAAFNAAELYLDANDIGNVTHTGGRISALWKPNDDLSLTLQYLYQDAEQDGWPYVQLNTGGYTQVALSLGENVPELVGRAEGVKDEINLTNLVAEYELDWVTLSSSTAWMKTENSLITETSSFVGGLPAVQQLSYDNEVFVEEVRLVSSLEGPFQFVTGLYYEDIDVSVAVPTWITGDQSLNFLGNPFGDTNPLINIELFDRPIEQLSFYGELSYSITEQLEFTVGARRYDYEREFNTTADGALGIASGSFKTEESGTIFKTNLSYKPNEDMLAYVRWSEGFRLGDTNRIPSSTLCDVNNDGILDGTAAPFSPGFDSDSAENYELGVKMSLLDKRLQINAAIYRMDWKGIPLRIFGGKLPEQEEQICFLSVTLNAGEARSQGFELETTYQVNEHLRLSLGGAYTDAELTEDFSIGGAFSGDRLPSSPDYNVNFGVVYDFDFVSYPSYFQADYAYISEFYNRIGERGDKAGGYGQLNINMGVSVDNFNVDIFLNNLTNEDDLTLVGVLYPDSRAYRLRPRTIGLNLGFQF